MELPPRILIVDGDLSLSEVLSTNLSRDGLTVETVTSGKAGILLATCNGYDFLIISLQLSDMDGLDVVEAIRRYSPDIVPIIVTGTPSLEGAIKALRFGVFDYLEKPVALQTIRDVISRAMIKRKLKAISSTRNSNSFFLDIQMLVHQINNPLSAIMGSAYLALLHIENAQNVKKQIQSILKSTFEASEITKNIFSPIVKAFPGSTTVLLRNVIESCIGVFEDLLLYKGIDCKKEISGLDDLLIPGDRFYFEQVFKNLLSNAIEAMERSKVKRLFITAETNSELSRVIVRIEDTGCGIPTNRLKKIFMPGQTSKPNGSGFGLYVVESMLKKMNCWIDCESEIGKGSTFRIFIPFDNGRGK